MARLRPSGSATNQTPPFENVDLLAADAPLREAVALAGAAPARQQRLAAFARWCGSGDALELARQANVHPPILHAFDAAGQRCDTVEYHPAYHRLMQASVAEGLASAAWSHLAEENGPASPPPAETVLRAAGLYLAAQAEPGHCCPLTMTNAAVAALLAAPELAEAWIPRILRREYDARFIPAPAKTGVLLGMAMTERQGGTDVRANTTRAEPSGDLGGGEHVLTGHKWFLSAPMSDAFLVLAQAPGGLSCFLVPRFLPDGSLNGLHLQRLKDKLGNRSNASAEVEIDRAHGWLVGAEGRGIASIMPMVTLTRLDCAVSSAGLMRQALALAIHHARHRAVFGRRLAEHPLMLEVLADMALDVEAATALVFRLAAAMETPEPASQAFVRLMTPVVKYWVCKTAPALVAEAMECLGGNGYVETGPAARLYREVPVNAIWEGSGNVMALDVLRVLQREPEVAGQVIDDLAAAVAGDAALEAGLGRVHALLQDPRMLDRRARELVELLALVAAGTALRVTAPAAISEAFATTRLGSPPRATYGQGLARFDTLAIVDRTLPS